MVATRQMRMSLGLHHRQEERQSQSNARRESGRQCTGNRGAHSDTCHVDAWLPVRTVCQMHGEQPNLLLPLLLLAPRARVFASICVDSLDSRRSACALCVQVCLNDFVTGDRVRSLPCIHLYHSSCIGPSAHSSSVRPPAGPGARHRAHLFPASALSCD